MGLSHQALDRCCQPKKFAGSHHILGDLPLQCIKRIKTLFIAQFCAEHHINMAPIEIHRHIKQMDLQLLAYASDGRTGTDIGHTAVLLTRRSPTQKLRLLVTVNP